MSQSTSNMSQLPPKVPRMTQNCPDFFNQMIDDPVDSSSASRRSHRRSISDSAAFVEARMVEECRRSSTMPAAGSNIINENAGDQQFDDMQQLMMMFSEGVAVGPTLSCSNASSPSTDYCSINDDDRMLASSEEVLSSCKYEEHNETSGISTEMVFDPKRIKRILANRHSAQKSRVKKLQYISELERSVNSLEGEVSILSPRVAFLDHQRLMLNVDNTVLKQRIAALAQDTIFKDAHQEALRREIERLRQVHYQQTQKMEISNEPHRKPDFYSAENEQLPVN